MSDSILGIGEFSRDYASPTIFERLIIREYILNLCDKLDQDERDVLTLHFFNCMSMRDISDFLNMSLSKVARTKARAVKTLFYMILEEKKLL